MGTTEPSELRCRACRGAALARFRRGSRAYGTCRACGTINALMTRAEYEAISPSYDPGPAPGAIDIDALRRELAVPTKVELLTRYLLSRSEGPPRRVLDVGCGAGGYLLAARDLGHEAVGVEPSDSHSAIARSLGFEVIRNYFFPRDFEPRSFDLVIAYHVIEHIYDQPSFIDDLARVVKPGGMIVLVTPNAASVSALLSGRYWVMLKPIDHVTMLTPQAFFAMGLERLGHLNVRQSALDGEHVTAVAAAARDALLRRDNIEVSTMLMSGIVPTTGKQRLRTLLTRLGGPLDFVARRTDRQATLVVELTLRP